MLTLLNSLLDLTQLENGQMPLRPDLVNVKELVEHSLQQVSMWAKTRSVTLAFQPEANAETIYADRSLTMRVLVNLLSNAIKFSPPQSMVTIQTTPYHTNQLVFSVSDQGPGIPAEWTHKVFDKYVQVEAHKAKGTVIGSGLGLSFCRLAIEAQGGRIWIESGLDRGTKIAFTLPVNDR
jgi:signal transduction histidine kinase